MSEREPALRVPLGPMDHKSRLVLASVVGVLALACITALWRVVGPIALHVPLDPNEGWNAYYAAAAMAGPGPYPDASGFMTNNYPPLSFYIVGTVAKVFGDYIVAGRVVSLLAFLALGGGIAALVRKSGCGWLEAIFASLIFAGFLLLNSDYVGMDDPQLLGHAVQFCALLIFLTRKESLPTDLTCAALFVAGLFIKHNLVAMPLAIIIWLSLSEWRRAARLAAFMLLFGFFGLAACRIAFGFELLGRLNSARMYSLSLFAANFRVWLIPAALSFAATLAVGTTRDRFAVFCAVYALVSILIGGIFLGGAGVDANAMFDADMAVALGAGIALGRIGKLSRLGTALAGPMLALVLALPLALETARAYDSSWLERDFWLHPMRDEAGIGESDIAYLRAHKGPAICEMLSLCYWAAKPASVDVFNLEQQFLTHRRDMGAFVRLLNARAFAVIQLDSLSPFPAQVQSAIRQNYHVDRTNDDGLFLIPKTANQ
jgi:dolichyl-phosphate-mannose-protein mannosyltransferase